MVGLCKTLAIVVLVFGLLFSLVLAGTTEADIVTKEGPYSWSDPVIQIGYNFEYAISGCFNSFIFFVVLFSIGEIAEQAKKNAVVLEKLVKRMEESEKKSHEIGSASKPKNESLEAKPAEKENSKESEKENAYWDPLAVIPIPLKGLDKVICPRCQTMQEKGNERCDHCGRPFAKGHS